MARKDGFVRLVQKRTPQGATPSIPLSDDHTDGTWTYKDLYDGEISINDTGEFFYRSLDTIYQLQSATGSGGGETLEQTLALGNDSGVYDIIMGTATTIGTNGGTGRLLLDSLGNGDVVKIDAATGSRYARVVVDGYGEVNFIGQNGSTQSDMYINEAGIQVSTTTGVGIEYSVDYSATFTNRSLVDKEYVDNIVALGVTGLGSVLAIDNQTTGNDIILDNLAPNSAGADKIISSNSKNRIFFTQTPNPESVYIVSDYYDPGPQTITSAQVQTSYEDGIFIEASLDDTIDQFNGTLQVQPGSVTSDVTNTNTAQTTQISQVADEIISTATDLNTTENSTSEIRYNQIRTFINDVTTGNYIEDDCNQTVRSFSIHDAGGEDLVISSQKDEYLVTVENTQVTPFYSKLRLNASSLDLWSEDTTGQFQTGLFVTDPTVGSLDALDSSNGTGAQAGVFVDGGAFVAGAYLSSTDGATSYSSILTVHPDDIKVNGTNPAFAGIEYDNDYSTNYTNRSLVDKEYVDNLPGGGATPSLSQVLAVGNTSGANDIQFDTTQGLYFNNTSRLREGTIDAGYGGNKGIAQICAVGYEMKWESGSLYIMNGDGTQIREVRYTFGATPSTTDDLTKGFTIGSRWVLDNGDIYSCSDNATASSVWNLEVTAQTLGQTLIIGNETEATDILLSNSVFAGTSDNIKAAGNLFADAKFTFEDYGGGYWAPSIRVDDGSATNYIIVGSQSTIIQNNLINEYSKIEVDPLFLNLMVNDLTTASGSNINMTSNTIAYNLSNAGYFSASGSVACGLGIPTSFGNDYIAPNPGFPDFHRRGSVNMLSGPASGQPTYAELDSRTTDGSSYAFIRATDMGGAYPANVFEVGGSGSPYSQIEQKSTYITIFSSNPSFEGIKYDTDWSANFVARSLVDKAYVDAAVSGIPGTPTLSAVLVVGNQANSHIDMNGYDVQNVQTIDATNVEVTTIYADPTTGIETINMLNASMITLMYNT